MTNKTDSKNQWLVVEGIPGLTIAPSGTPLTRLNYFDGKFLRASDLKLEQDAQRQLVHLSNLAGGFGIVYGFDTQLLDAGDLLGVGPGQAIDAEGRVLLLPMEVQVEISKLIERSLQLDQTKCDDKAKPGNKSEVYDCEPLTYEPPVIVGADAKLWLITIAHAEFLCGEEDVYGKLCEQACVTSTDRPFRIEGVVLRARPLQLTSPLVTSSAVALVGKHLRSRVASAYFADERKTPASLISGAGLRSHAWCLGAQLATGEVALGVLARQGASNLWFDAWTARRERMDPPPRAYWAHRMAMRPWREFLAQVLQFQCQLAELLADLASGGGVLIDPCSDKQQMIINARSTVEGLIAKWAQGGFDKANQLGALTLETLDKLRKQLDLGDAAKPGKPTLGPQILIDGGIVELPPAGYLPVDPANEMTVNEQVRRLLGEGVDLRFCVVRPDDVARELEGAQHMDRISLLSGLDDPSNKPPIDILVPDGRIIEHDKPAEGLGFRAKLGIGSLPDDIKLTLAQLNKSLGSALLTKIATLGAASKFHLRGAARAARTPSGGGVAHLAALGQADKLVGFDIDKVGAVVNMPKAADALKQKYGKQADANQPAEAVPPGMFEAKQPIYAKQAYAEYPGYVNEGGAHVAGKGVIATWFDVEASADPFTIALGTSFNASFMLRANAFGSRVEYQLVGQVQVLYRQPLVLNGVTYGTLATGKLTGFESMQGMDSSDGTSNSEYTVMLIDASPAGSVDGLVISLTPVKGKALLDNDAVFAWDGQSLDVAGLWVFKGVAQQGAPQMAVTALDQDDAIQSETDPDHIAALQALQEIANQIEDPSFAKQAAAKLFPPAPDASELLEIQAVHDWVLFHARHRKECSREQIPSPAPELRKYRVYTYELPHEEFASAVMDALRQDEELLEQLGFVEIATVEFDAGVSALRTSADTLEALWKSHGEGRNLVYASIASAGPAIAEGEAIALGRLLSVEQVVERVSTPYSDQKSELLAQVPHVFTLGSEAGVIVLLTLPAAELRLSLWGTHTGGLDLLKSPGDHHIDDIVKELGIRQIANASFRGEQMLEFALVQPVYAYQVPIVFLYTRKQDQGSLPEIDQLESCARATAEKAGVDISKTTIDHVEYEYGWSDASYGNVIVFICGELGWPNDE